MRKLMECPSPGIGQSTTPRAPCSETQPIGFRTYGEVLQWPGLREGARELLNSLDNTRRIHDKPHCGMKDGGSFEAAANQADVFAFVMNFMYRVNYVLKQLGSSVKCVGGGGGRSMSCTDLIVRLVSAQSSLTDMSRQVLATILVQGDWKFDLKPGESLEDAPNDPQRGEANMAAVQKVCANEESPNFPLPCMICHRKVLLLPRQASSAGSWPGIVAPLNGRPDPVMALHASSKTATCGAGLRDGYCGWGANFRAD